MISKVKKFTIFFISNPEDFLRKLQKFGIVEIENFSFEGFTQQFISSEKIEEKIRKLEFLKNILEEIEGKKFQGKILVSENEEKEIIEKFPLEDIYSFIYSLKLDQERREKIIQRIEKLKQEIFPLINTDIVFSEVFNLTKFKFSIFTLSKKKKISQIPENIMVEKIGENENEFIYLLLFRENEISIAEDFLKQISGKIISVRRWNKKIKEVFEKLTNIEKENEKKIEEIKNQISKILIDKNKIFVLYDYFKTILEFLSTRQKLGVSKFIRGIKGWIKEKNIPLLEKLIQENMPESYILIEEPGNEDIIPISFENNNLVEPFEVVTDLYGRPVYKNIDPTGPLSIFFAISFGFCLTDAGYGIILIILSLILMRKFKFYPGIIKFLKLLLICGISTVFLGAITGGWFGDIIYRLPENFPVIAFLKKIVILNPMSGGNQIITFLLWALIIGYIQIVWGLILNLYNSIRNYSIKNSGEAISVLLIQILVGIIIISFLKNKIIFKFSLIFLLLCFLYLMIEKMRSQKNFMMKLFWGIFGVYNVIAGNLLGDILSYSRLFGLGLTTSVLALAVDEIVYMIKGVAYIGYLLAIILFIIGHFGNMLINLLGSYVHTSRLQYLEFFTKFFESGGRPFIPFQEIRNYTIKKEI